VQGTIAIEETEAARLVIRIVAAIGPVTSDTIAAAGFFESTGSLLPAGTILALERSGFVTRQMMGSGVRDVFCVELTDKGRALLDQMIEEWAQWIG